MNTDGDACGPRSSLQSARDGQDFRFDRYRKQPTAKRLTPSGRPLPGRG